MRIGYDATEAAAAACAHRIQGDVGAGILLTGYGTAPDPDAVDSSGLEQAVKCAMGFLTGGIDQTLSSNGRLDLRYAAAKILDALQSANRQIRQYGRYVGQGVYVGGTVTYIIPGGQYLLAPFGGCAAYTADSSLQVTRQGDTGEKYVTDALGCRETWSGKFWQGTLSQDCRLICLSDQLNLTEIHAQIQMTGGAANHPNTTAMVLRRILEHSSPYPAAVLEWRL